MTALPGDGRVLVDTNVLAYSYDAEAGAKHSLAVAIVAQLAQSGRLVLSVQVLNELVAFLFRRTKPAKSCKLAADIVSELTGVAEILPLRGQQTATALRGVEGHGLSFWDALLWATALENGVKLILTEDFQHGRNLEGVRFVNPFAESTG